MLRARRERLTCIAVTVLIDVRCGATENFAQLLREDELDVITNEMDGAAGRLLAQSLICGPGNFRTYSSRVRLSKDSSRSGVCATRAATA